MTLRRERRRWRHRRAPRLQRAPPPLRLRAAAPRHAPMPAWPGLTSSPRARRRARLTLRLPLRERVSLPLRPPPASPQRIAPQPQRRAPPPRRRGPLRPPPPRAASQPLSRRVAPQQPRHPAPSRARSRRAPPAPRRRTARVVRLPQSSPFRPKPRNEAPTQAAPLSKLQPAACLPARRAPPWQAPAQSPRRRAPPPKRRRQRQRPRDPQMALRLLRFRTAAARMRRTRRLMTRRPRGASRTWGGARRPRRAAALAAASVQRLQRGALPTRRVLRSAPPPHRAATRRLRARCPLRTPRPRRLRAWPPVRRRVQWPRQLARVPRRARPPAARAAPAATPRSAQAPRAPPAGSGWASETARKT